jgi:hypothetical protein
MNQGSYCFPVIWFFSNSCLNVRSLHLTQTQLRGREGKAGTYYPPCLYWGPNQSGIENSMPAQEAQLRERSGDPACRGFKKPQTGAVAYTEALSSNPSTTKKKSFIRFGHKFVVLWLWNRISMRFRKVCYLVGLHSSVTIVHKKELIQSQPRKSSKHLKETFGFPSSL